MNRVHSRIHIGARAALFSLAAGLALAAPAVRPLTADDVIGRLALLPAYMLVSALIEIRNNKTLSAFISRVSRDFLAVGLVLVGYLLMDAPYSVGTIALPLILGVAGLTLDLGTALGVWFAINLLILPHLSVGPVVLSGSNDGPWSYLGLLGLAATLPILLYTRKLSNSASAVRPFGLKQLAAGAILLVCTVSIAYLAAFGVARKIPAIATSARAFDRLPSMTAIAADINARFTPNDVSPRNQVLTKRLVEMAGISGQHLYIFKRTSANNQPNYRFVVGARFIQGPSIEAKALDDLHLLKAAERRAVLRAVESLTSEEYGPFAEEKLISAGLFGKTVAISTYPGGAGADYLLIASPSNPRWFQDQAINPWIAMADVFPYLYLSFVFMVSTSLFPLMRRDELRSQLIQSEERARIKQDAHDRVANRLSTLAMRVEEKSVELDEGRTFYANLPDALRHIVSDLHTVMAEQASEPVDAEAFVNGLEDICRRRERESGFKIATNFEIAPNTSLDLKQQEAIAALIEEALGNVAKHANAKNVRVELVVPADGDCRLTVNDNGRGFIPPGDYSALTAAGHLGLAGMAKRAHELGGELRVESEPGKGTTVVITWPAVINTKKWSSTGVKVRP